MEHTVLLYYKYAPLTDPEAERLAQRELCERLGLKGRILLGAEGINGTVAGSAEATTAYMETMRQHPVFHDVEYKIDTTAANPFPRLRIRVRDEIVTLGAEPDLANTAPHVSPEQFRELMKDPNVVLFDARNNYESAIGKFKGAITPDIDLFKDLPAALQQYENLKAKKVITYCTGGIRCEKASAYMKEQGFQDVSQLDGGIINYAQKYPDDGWEGECFVFDDRMSVGFKDSPELLGQCVHCDAATNTYRNCGLKTCNKLILVCPDHDQAAVTCGAACASQLAAV
jgi:UPF0176 protein